MFVMWYYSIKIATHVSVHICNCCTQPWCVTFLWYNDKIPILAEMSDVTVLHTDVTLLQLWSTHPHLFAMVLCYSATLRPVQTMEHILRHSLTQQPRTWCSLVGAVSKHAANMLWICSEAKLYCRGTNQKLSVFRTNTKAFLATECWFSPATAAVCATNIFSQTLEHHVCGWCGGCAAEHIR